MGDWLDDCLAIVWRLFALNPKLCQKAVEAQSNQYRTNLECVPYEYQIVVDDSTDFYGLPRTITDFKRLLVTLFLSKVTKSLLKNITMMKL